MGQPLNTPFDPSGCIREATSRLHKANVVMSRSTLRERITVVSCQLARLRLLDTADTMNAPLVTLNTTHHYRYHHTLSQNMDNP